MIFHFGGDRMNRGRPVGGAASPWDQQQMGGAHSESGQQKMARWFFLQGGDS